MELLEWFVPLFVAVLTAVTPIVLTIHSSGRKDRAQGKENSEKLCGAVESLKDSIDRMDTRRHFRTGRYQRLLSGLSGDHQGKPAQWLDARG